MILLTCAWHIFTFTSADDNYRTVSSQSHVCSDDTSSPVDWDQKLATSQESLSHSTLQWKAAFIEQCHTHPPILKAPTPPFQARTNEGSANRETGLKDPVAKYGPTGPMMTKIIAFPARDTPRDGCRRGRRRHAGKSGKSVFMTVTNFKIMTQTMTFNTFLTLIPVNNDEISSSCIYWHFYKTLVILLSITIFRNIINHSLT